MDEMKKALSQMVEDFNSKTITLDEAYIRFGNILNEFGVEATAEVFRTEYYDTWKAMGGR